MTRLLSFALGIPRRIWAVVAWSGVALLALIGAYKAGGDKARSRAAEKAGNDYIETRRRIDDVEIDDDLAVIRDKLRERGKSGGDL